MPDERQSPTRKEKKHTMVSSKTWCECSGSINSPLMILQILCPGPADSIMMFSNTVMYNVQCKCMHIVWCDVLTVYHWHTIHKSHSVNQEIDFHSILPRHKTLTNNFLTKPMTEYTYIKYSFTAWAWAGTIKIIYNCGQFPSAASDTWI